LINVLRSLLQDGKPQCVPYLKFCMRRSVQFLKFSHENVPNMFEFSVTIMVKRYQFFPYNIP